MRITIRRKAQIQETPRVLQLRGMFDLPPDSGGFELDVQLAVQEKPWSIGLITGPSGCGKSTLAREAFSQALWADSLPDWPSTQSIVDSFPEHLSMKDICELLSSVGFSSPPAWLRPFQVLSTGQQFRATLARLLGLAEATPSPLPVIVFDEYTSVVDRTVARIGSAAVGRVIRKRGYQFVAVTCHEDVEEWLQPDWLCRPAERTFAWRCLRRRPPVTLTIVRCSASAWRLFAPHHYLSHALAGGAICFLATASIPGPASLSGATPVAFSAWLPFVGKGPPTRREHRTVTLPDYQGIGIGNALSACVASMWKGLGYRAISTTTHPAMIHSRLRSKDWRMQRAPSLASRGSRRERRLRHATTRLTAGFEYVGQGMNRQQAQSLLGR
jgi:GNAT superfamily N-acetyltransferase